MFRRDTTFYFLSDDYVLIFQLKGNKAVYVGSSEVKAEPT